MKRIIFLSFLTIVFLTNTIQSQPLAVRAMLRSYDTGKEVTRVRVPGCMMKMAAWFVDEPETKALLKKMGAVYVMTTEDHEYSRDSDFPSRAAKAFRKRNFEELMSVSDSKDQVTFLMKEGPRGKKELLIAVDGEEDTVVYIRGRFEFDDLAKSGDIKIGGVSINKLGN